MRSPIKKRSLQVDGRKTSISLEDAFWSGLKEIAAARAMTLSALVSDVARDRTGSNLSSALRILVLNSVRLEAGTAAPGRRPKRVLVVDDDPLVLGLTAEMLADLGCDVRTAGNGAEALEAIAIDRRIEILITDVNMPGMSGYELADRAKQARARLQVILLSGRESDPHGLPLIRKPFLESDLKRVMSQTTGLC